ncbi:MAG: diaminopimelate epimerase [Planctomycetes bacterium SM23_32]|nr:MAG: diaminopimelate epimerase [Planctomycetes bacterium SM23_32]
MRFWKYHGLGNDYVVLDAAEAGETMEPARVRVICHRNYGVGSDGILLGPLPAEEAEFGVRIYNPDGSEAEKSGNGLRIFSRWLFDTGRVGEDEFTIWTLGGLVRSRVSDGGRQVTVEMGRVSFHSADIPVGGPPREVINEEIEVCGQVLTFCAATVGNPHCVIPRAEVSAEEARALGPHIETDPRFPNRTNVQFMQVLDPASIRIEIWERGAGYTLASGSSASAAAAVARRLGQCDRRVAVHMPGGRLDITVADDFAITMTGPVTRVAEGTVAEEALAQDV